MNFGGFSFFALLMSLGLSPLAHAQNQITYEGILTDSSGVAVPNGTYNMRFQVRSRDVNNCILHEETRTITTNAGQFITSLNSSDGSGVVTNTGLSFDDVFSAMTLSVNPSLCDSGSSPSTPDRLLSIDLFVSGSWTHLGAVSLTSSPHTFRANQVGTTSESQILRTAPGTPAPVLTNAQLSSLMNTLNGNYSGHAASADVCTNLSGTLSIANGGTGATTAATARTNLGLGSLAVVSPSGTASATTYLRGDGTWATPSAGGTITSFNGQTDASQILTTGSANTEPTWSSISGTHTLNIPRASTAGVTAGLLSNSDYQSFSNTATTVTSASPTATSSGLVSRDGTGQSTFSGVVLKNGSLTTTLSRAAGGANYNLTLPANSGTAGQLLALSSSQDISYRNLAASDLPLVPVNKGGTGTTTLAPNQLVAADGTGSTLQSIGCVAGQLLSFNVSQAWECMNVESLPYMGATTGPLTFYVSSSGSDSNSGLTAGSPFQTIQRALSAVPQKILHPVTISVAAGTYTPSTSPTGYSDAWLVISKDIHYQTGGLLTISGSGSATIQNANSWQIGILIPSSAQGVQLENLYISNFIRAGIQVDGGIALIGSAAKIVSLSSSMTMETGIEVTNNGHAALNAVGIGNFTQSGISVSNGGSVRIETGSVGMTFPSTSNYLRGIEIRNRGSFEIDGGSLAFNSVSAAANATGIDIEEGSFSYRAGAFSLSGVSANNSLIRSRRGRVSLNAFPNWSGTAQSLLSCSERSSCTIGDSNSATPITMMGMLANTLFSVSENSMLENYQPLQVGSSMSVQTWFLINTQSNFLISRAFTINTSTTGNSFIKLQNGSSLQVRANLTYGSASFDRWFDLSNNSQIHATSAISTGATPTATQSILSLSGASSAVFESALSLSAQTSNALSMSGTSSLITKGAVQVSTNGTPSINLKLEGGSSAEIQGSFTSVTHGGGSTTAQVTGGSTLRFAPTLTGTAVSLTCSGTANDTALSATNRSSIVFESGSGSFSASSQIHTSCEAIARASRHSNIQLPPTSIITPGGMTVAIEKNSTYSKGATTATHTSCSDYSTCD